MFEDITIDYDRVHSSTATVDGERIVITLHTGNGATNISLPASEVPRLIAAISTAAGMAKEAYTGNPTHLAFAVRKIEVRTRERVNHVLLVLELLGGAELTFEIEPQTALQCSNQIAQTLESMTAEPRSLQ